MRISGIATGFDTESMVKEMLSVEQTRVNNYLRKQTTYLWKQEAYNNINKSMANFILNSRKDFGLTQITAFGTVRQSSLNSLSWVKKATSSHESIVTAKTRADAINGSHTIEVKNLASSAILTSENLKGTVVDANGKFLADGTYKIQTSVDGELATVEINVTAGSSISELVSKINNAKIGDKSVGLRASYDSGIGKLMISTRETGADKFIRIAESPANVFNGQQATVTTVKLEDLVDENGTFINPNLEFNIQIGSESFTIKDFSSIKCVISELKNKGVDASFDKNSKEIVINSPDVTITNVNTGDTLTAQKSVIQKSGEDAEITFNGDTIKKNTNNFTIFGIELNLKSAQVGTTVSINVDTDVDSIYEKISNFVDSYNKLVDEINGKLNEKTYRKYYPLIDEEKSAMKEEDIKLWESKAKSGLLRNDMSLSRALQNIRSSLYEKVEGGTYNHITQIGITTGNYKDGGKLVIDEEKLKDAIMNDPEGVMNLFFKVPETTEMGEQRIKESGLLQRVYDGLIVGMKDVVRQSGTGDDANLLREVQSNILIDFVTDQGSISLIDRDLLSLAQRITREQKLLADKETRYWKQFSAMEKAISQMNQQSSWLTAQLGFGQ